MMAHHPPAEFITALRGFSRRLEDSSPPLVEQAGANEASVGMGEMQLRLLTDDAARCLDSTHAGYYYQPSAGAANGGDWAIYLQGGGLCVEPVDCLWRARTHLGTSSKWPQRMQDDRNILSTGSFNPFRSFHHVFVPYCSGDMYIGRQRENNSFGLRFSGHLILEAIVNDLEATLGLGTAKRVLLSGGSAGGYGSFHHADWLSSRLSTLAPAADVGVAPQSGAFFVSHQVLLWPELELRRNRSTVPSVAVDDDTSASAGIAAAAVATVAGLTKLSNASVSLTTDAAPTLLPNFSAYASGYLYAFFGGADAREERRPYLDASCLAAHVQRPWQCWSVAVLFEHVSTRVFVAQNRFDRSQAGDVLGANWWPLPLAPAAHAAAKARFLRYFGNRTSAGIVAMVQNGSDVSSSARRPPATTSHHSKLDADGLWVPSCYSHTGNMCMRGGTRVRGVSLAASLYDWFVRGSAQPHQLVDDCPGEDPCNPSCEC